MRTSILICATCLLVTGCSAQFRLPSLSSALSSLTGFGGSSSNSNGAQSGQSSSPSSPYSGLVRDYGRNLMMAMSSIYPTLFKPPQSQQQQQQPQQAQQQAQPSPFESFNPSQQLFSGQGGPSFTLGGSTFSISPSFPFGSLGGAGSGGPSQSQGAGQAPQAAGSSHSPFSASFGSSINSPPSFGPLSSGPFLSQSMPSFAPPSSYGAAFEAANGGGPNSGPNSAMFAGLNQASGPSSIQSMGSMPSASQLQAQANQLGGQSFGSISSGFGGQHDSSSAQLLSQPSHHQPQSISPQQVGSMGNQQQHSSGPFGGQQQNQQPFNQQYPGSQQFRPDSMSIAASAPMPSSSQYSNYGSVPAQQGQAPSASISASSYQQPSYR